MPACICPEGTLFHSLLATAAPRPAAVLGTIVNVLGWGESWDPDERVLQEVSKVACVGDRLCSALPRVHER